jgi:hypothetical protein
MSRASHLLWLGLAAAAAAVGWALRGSSVEDEEAGAVGREQAEGATDAVAPVPARAAPVVGVFDPTEDLPRPEGVAWLEAPFRLAPGTEAVTGADLLGALEEAGAVRVRTASSADLEALRAARIDLPRGEEMHGAVLVPTLDAAGFACELRRGMILVRQRPREDSDR